MRRADRRAARARHVTLDAAHVVDRVEAGGTWHCVDGCGASGTVDDPGASPLAAAAVLDGRRLYGRARTCKAVIAVTDPGHADSLLAVHPGARGGAGGRVARGSRRLWAPRGGGGDRRGGPGVRGSSTRRRRGGDAGVRADRRRGARHPLRAGGRVGRRAGRDVVGAAGAHASGPMAGRSACVAGFSAYARGDGPLAGVSLEAALRSDPDHRMAGMLDTALQSGMRPEQIRELAGTGYRLAKRLGVRLPPRRAFGRRAVSAVRPSRP